MGQANKRGTFEQRQSEAYERIDQAAVGMTEHLAKLDKLEQESDAKVTKIVTAFLEQEELRRKRRLGIRIGGGNGKTGEGVQQAEAV